ncbi:MAG: hypothetical protein ABSG28_00960 [Methanoregula sp.]|jgi:hypothetical protein|uniref:hypothetical protein n=1 Tax=Methanoregula sp. TaxID=2052170 RepID=UPI003C26C4B4
MIFLESIPGIPELAQGVPVSARIPAIILVILIAYVAFRLYRHKNRHLREVLCAFEQNPDESLSSL